MIVRKSLNIRIVIRVAWRRLTVIALLSVAVKTLPLTDEQAFLDGIRMIEGILGTAVSILIGFRVNSAYERWWEAQRAWGMLVTETRTFSRQVVSLISTHFHPERDDFVVDGSRRELILGMVGLAYALKNHLRCEPDMQREELSPFFSNSVLDGLLASKHVPVAILVWLARRLQISFENRHTEDFRHMQIDATLNRVTDAIGTMDRIKTTVFPRQYSIYSTMFTALFAYLLPLALIPIGGWPILPFVMAVGFIFFALDSIAGAIENPFENTYNDAPMSYLARSIEIQLRETLGDSDLPQPVAPINGMLW